ncbi:hypothetical protein Dimus_012030 [Dionaea muscipula]
MEIPASFSLLLFLALSTPMSVVRSLPWSSLEVGFYNSTCPEAESIVTNMVDNFISSNPGIGASLIRLHFHDCFVRGCDASVLIDSTPSNPSEQASPINLSLRGFDQIAAIKAAVEAACPGTVSCADILAFAARDSAAKLGNISYQVPAGRRDGTVSLESDPLKPNNIPQFTYNLSQLTANFEAKGLSQSDMVILSGAHSVGIAHCSSFTNRLYPELDPTLDPAFAAQLRNVCPSSNTTASNPTAPLDHITPNKLDNRLGFSLGGCDEETTWPLRIGCHLLFLSLAFLDSWLELLADCALDVHVAI